jgi:uncharacterized protein involved in exopolysaccharide biosynthesis
MTAPASSFSLRPIDCLALASKYRWRWITPTLVGLILGSIYATVRPDKWEAAQALLIRNEASNNIDGVGKFRHVDDMKVTQETLLELAKGRQVLSEALTKVGPPSGSPAAHWPTDIAIERLRKHVKLAPPKGAEFGKTELFYLKATDSDRQRSIDLAAAISMSLQTRYQEVLNKKATSMVRELENGVTLAKASVVESSSELAAMESQVGADLAELRILHASPSGTSDLRQKVVFIEGEIRRLETTQRSNQELDSLLRAAQQDPSHLVAAPNSLLESQPALKRLKEGLVDAQIKTAQLAGMMTESHPQLIAAQISEQQIRSEIHAELAIAIRGVEADARLLAGQVQNLQKQLDETNVRLARIARLRTDYSNCVAEVEQANKLLAIAESNLADARAKESGAEHASLINRIDVPDAGTKPVGPGRVATAGMGAVAGFLFGVALLVITIPLPRPNNPTSIGGRLFGRRAMDGVHAGPVAEPQAAAPAPLPATSTSARPQVTPHPAAATAPSAPDRRGEAPQVKSAPRSPRAATASGENLNLKQALERIGNA